ncbi:MAG: hypothetical protein M3Z25_14860 [Actinomycetota bacterium]|nr:hypothetical protein [Actinomycetota bacterium]
MQGGEAHRVDDVIAPTLCSLRTIFSTLAHAVRAVAVAADRGPGLRLPARAGAGDPAALVVAALGPRMQRLAAAEAPDGAGSSCFSLHLRSHAGGGQPPGHRRAVGHQPQRE